MADDNSPPLGTAALRRQAAIARASAGAAMHVAPAPPPDEASVPWAGHREPVPHTIEAERRQALIQDRVNVNGRPARKAKPVIQAPKPAPPDIAFDLVDKIVAKWVADVKQHNIGYANTRLARQLMRNAPVLIKHEYKIDQLAAVIRLSNELVKNTGEDDTEDKRIEAFRDILSRSDITSTVPENAETDEESDQEGDEAEEV